MPKGALPTTFQVVLALYDMQERANEGSVRVGAVDGHGPKMGHGHGRKRNLMAMASHHASGASHPQRCRRPLGLRRCLLSEAGPRVVRPFRGNDHGSPLAVGVDGCLPIRSAYLQRPFLLKQLVFDQQIVDYMFIWSVPTKSTSPQTQSRKQRERLAVD